MKYLLLGAGMQGTAIAFDLLRHAEGTTALTIYDQDETSLAALRARLDDPRVQTVAGDVRDHAKIEPLARDADVLISAVNYWCNVDLAELAIACGTHMVDLGGNYEVVEKQLALDARAREHGVTIIPDCGLAPGLAGLLGYHLHAQFDRVDSLRLRVGGLPQHPRPPLDYMLVFSVHGLINEYIEPCLCVRGGELRFVPALSEIEEIEFPIPMGRFEAFHTSGGISTLPRTLAGRVRDMDYKTIRYRGHAEKIRTLVQIGLTDSAPVTIDGHEVSPCDFLATMLTRVLSVDDQDLVLLLAECDGTSGGRALRRSVRIVDRHDADHNISAMMRMTGYPTAIIARMLAAGVMKVPGAHPQELVVPMEPLLEELRRRGIVPEFWETPLA
jgi:lysine 6-dehydrogenase